MHNVSVPLANKIKQSIDVNSAVRVIAEWNMNRYSKIESVTNGTSPVENEFDNEVFPIESIVEPERPTRGILKALSSSRLVRYSNDGNGADGFTQAGFNDRPSAARFTTASKDDKYKYWVSPNESTATTPSTITNVAPTVLYSATTWANKLYICVDNSYTSPTQFTVQVSTNGTTWTTVATNPTIDSKGRIQLYRQANGTWSDTVYRENPQQIRGVRLSVTELSQRSSRFSLIEMGARIESDLSTFVESYNVSNTMSDTSFIAPIGKASSNTGSANLDNTSLRFVNSNPNSLYYNILDKNVEVRIDVGINIGTYAAPNFEWVRQATMRTENWGGQTYEGVSVDLKDASDYLQTVKPLPTLLQKVTVAEAIWRILDSVGFSNWVYERFDVDPNTLIDHCWFDGEKTVWEEIQNLAEATQTAVYFDEYGMLQIKTRNSAFNLSNTPVWTLDEVKNGTKQADIVDLNKTNDFEANVVNVNYKPTSLKEGNFYGGIVPIESVWEPENTLTLRSSQLTASITAADLVFSIAPTEAVVWQYTGIIQVEGEIIKYDAKEYAYYDAAGVKKTKWLVSDEEKKTVDMLNGGLAYLNAFTGRMRVPAGGRGVWNTPAMPHNVTLTGWTVNRYRTLNGAVKSWNGGLIHNKDRSTLTIRTNKTFIPNSWYVCTRSAAAGSIPVWYGTRVKFDKTSYTYGAAGIVFAAGSNDSGYFVELLRTDRVSANDRAKYTHELCFYKRDTNGAITRIGPDGNKGVPINIAPDVWYDLDVGLTTAANSTVHNISIAVNGQIQMNVGLTTNRLTLTERHGLFTRGNTSAEFEYFYSSVNTTSPSLPDEEWWNRIRGGYESGVWDRELVYNNTTLPGLPTLPRSLYRKPQATVAYRRVNRFYDEFGPIVHEIREFDVKFSKTPVNYSNIYFSNDAQVACVEYNGNPFGAKFVLANISRDNAVVSGEDTLSLGGDSSVDQQLMILGRTFSQEDVKTHTVKDAQGIKRRGEVVTDVESAWIQSESAAKAIGEWIVTHWAGGADELEGEIFGNPILQLLDVVSVNMPSSSMAEATHKYFIVRIDHEYSEGLSTKVTLRRMKI